MASASFSLSASSRMRRFDVLPAFARIFATVEGSAEDDDLLGGCDDLLGRLDVLLADLSPLAGCESVSISSYYNL